MIVGTRDFSRVYGMGFMTQLSPGTTLANFAANLRFEDIPKPVIQRTEDLFLDWFGAVLAGKGARAVEAIECFQRLWDPGWILRSTGLAPPDFAAFCRHGERRGVPLRRTGRRTQRQRISSRHCGLSARTRHRADRSSVPASDLLTAAVAGYETGIRVGEFLGRSHYKVFHTTGTAGTIAAAAAAGNLLRLTPEQMLNAFGSAGTQAAGSVGISARRRRLKAVAHGKSRGGWPAIRLSGSIGIYWRKAHL